MTSQHSVQLRNALYTTHLTNGMRLKVKAESRKSALMKSILFHPYMKV